MKYAKYYKDFFNQFPDDIPIALPDWGCDIERFRYSTDVGVVELELTSGFGLVDDKFIDTMFSIIKRNENH